MSERYNRQNNKTVKSRERERTQADRERRTVLILVTGFAGFWLAYIPALPLGGTLGTSGMAEARLFHLQTARARVLMLIRSLAETE